MGSNHFVYDLHMTLSALLLNKLCIMLSCTYLYLLWNLLYLYKYLRDAGNVALITLFMVTLSILWFNNSVACYQGQEHM